MTIATTLDRTLTAVPTELARGRGGGPAPKQSPPEFHSTQ